MFMSTTAGTLQATEAFFLYKKTSCVWHKLNLLIMHFSPIWIEVQLPVRTVRENFT